MGRASTIADEMAFQSTLAGKKGKENARCVFRLVIYLLPRHECPLREWAFAGVGVTVIERERASRNLYSYAVAGRE